MSEEQRPRSQRRGANSRSLTLGAAVRARHGARSQQPEARHPQQAARSKGSERGAENLRKERGASTQLLRCPRLPSGGLPDTQYRQTAQLQPHPQSYSCRTARFVVMSRRLPRLMVAVVRPRHLRAHLVILVNHGQLPGSKKLIFDLSKM